MSDAPPRLEDLTVFLLESPAFIPPPSRSASGSAELPRSASIEKLSIRSALLQTFLPRPATAPPAPSEPADDRRFAVPPESFSSTAVRFRHPPHAKPPARLSAFCLPSWVTQALLDGPVDVCFCLTQGDGARLFGSALQLCEPADDACGLDGGAAADGGGASEPLQLRSLVILSPWPTYELYKTLLHTIYSQREALWPPGVPLSPDRTDRPQPSRGVALARLLERTALTLRQSEQELRWLSNHALWLPTPLSPLFKSLRWSGSAVAYLLASLLTDQQILLHSSNPHGLYCATCALKALATPLPYSNVYIPLLPAHLMGRDEAATLLFDCSTPYLIGVETALLASLGGELPAAAVVVDLDRGQIRAAPSAPWLAAAAPPFSTLADELQRCMVAASFKPMRAQAACLRFVVDVLNFETGFLARSAAPADADAIARIRLLHEFAADVTARCEHATLPAVADALPTLRACIDKALGPQISRLCAEAAGSARGWGGGGAGGYLMSEISALMSDDDGAAPAGEPPACAALAHVYASQPFGDWWGQPERDERRFQWLNFRAKGIDLIEYLRENRASLKVLERSLEARLHAIWAEVGGSAAEPAAAAEPAGAGAPRQADEQQQPAKQPDAGMDGRRGAGEPTEAEAASESTGTAAEGAAPAAGASPTAAEAEASDEVAAAEMGTEGPAKAAASASADRSPAAKVSRHG